MIFGPALPAKTTPCRRKQSASPARLVVCFIAISLSGQVVSTGARAQDPAPVLAGESASIITLPEQPGAAGVLPVSAAAMARYRDPAQGVSANDLIRRALAANGELVAARMEVE